MRRRHALTFQAESEAKLQALTEARSLQGSQTSFYELPNDTRQNFAQAARTPHPGVTVPMCGCFPRALIKGGKRGENMALLPQRRYPAVLVGSHYCGLDKRWVPA
jgi:hypothetical protein